MLITTAYVVTLFVNDANSQHTSYVLRNSFPHSQTKTVETTLESSFHNTLVHRGPDLGLAAQNSMLLARSPPRSLSKYIYMRLSKN